MYCWDLFVLVLYHPVPLLRIGFRGGAGRALEMRADECDLFFSVIIFFCWGGFVVKLPRVVMRVTKLALY